MLGYEWAPIAGAIVGTLVGLTGVGGGALMAPILLVGFGLPLATVVAVDLLFASITKIVAGGIHNKNNLVDWKVSKRLWWGSVPATLIVVGLAYSGILFASSDLLTTLLGGLIIFSGLTMFIGKKVGLALRINSLESLSVLRRIQMPATMVAGGLLGVLVTATSIGAGALGAVFLRVLYPIRMSAPRLIATDTVHAIPVSLLGGISYLLIGETDLVLLAWLLLGSIPGAIIGSHLAAKAPAKVIKLLLGSVLVIAGFKLL